MSKEVRILDAYGKPMPSARERAMEAAKAEYNRRLKGSYDAAAVTSENAKHWQWADFLSAGEANRLSVRRVLRSRARYECHESNSFAYGITETMSTDFVTTGPRLQIRLRGSEKMRQVGEIIERRFARWMRKTKLAQKLWTARLAKCIDGESFLIAQTNPKLKDPVKLDVRLVECDQISTPGWVDGGLDPYAVDGLKFDKYGNVTEYHMLPAHPGDRFGAMVNYKDPIVLDPDHVIHLFKQRRPGQWRGIPEVTTALPLFAMLRRYTLATILAAEVAADFAVVLKTIVNAFDNATATPQNPFESVDIDRGMMTALPYGYEMQQMKAEQPTTTYEQFRNAILQEIARCLCMPTNKARGDSSGYNYSSARHDQQMYYHAIEVERGYWEIDCLDRIFEWWLDEALLEDRQLSRMLPPMVEIPRRWTWRPPVSIDPKTDADTAIALRDAGLLTEEEYFESRQMDPDYQWKQIARERAMRGEATAQPADGSTARKRKKSKVQAARASQRWDRIRVRNPVHLHAAL